MQQVCACLSDGRHHDELRMLMPKYFIKAKRVFTPLRKYGFFYTLAVAFIGLFYPIIGVSVLLVILGLMSVSFFKGRYWCGNFCAHGSLFDSALLKVSRNVRVPALFRSKWLAYAFFIFFTYNIASGLVRVSALYGMPLFFDRLGYIFVRSYLMVTLAGGFFAVVHAPRTWCHICPMGLMQKGSYTLGKWVGVTRFTDKQITIENPEMCHLCATCARVCPMQLSPYLNFNEAHQFEDINCIRCNTCVVHCPADVLSLSTQKEAKEGYVSVTHGYAMREAYESLILSKDMLKDDVLSITFGLIHDKPMPFQAGQFILARVQDNPLMYRAFSIVSYDAVTNALRVTIKRVKNGYGSDILFDNFQVGDHVWLEGPMGDELIVNKEEKHVVLVAGGIGITPFVSIVDDLIQDPKGIETFTLIYGVNYENELLYHTYFTDLHEANQAFTYVPVVAKDAQYEGEKGFVTDMISKLDLADASLYFCGPKPMIQASLALLTKLNVSKDKVFYESA